MSDPASKHKALHKTRNNFAESGRAKKKLVDTVKQTREKRRTQNLNARRNFDPSPEKEDPVLAKKKRIQLWKEERKKKMEEEAKNKRPPFRLYVYPKHTGTSPYSAQFKFANKKPSKGNLTFETFRFQAKAPSQNKDASSQVGTTTSSGRTNVTNAITARSVEPSGRTTRSQLKATTSKLGAPKPPTKSNVKVPETSGPSKTSAKTTNAAAKPSTKKTVKTTFEPRSVKTPVLAPAKSTTVAARKAAISNVPKKTLPVIDKKTCGLTSNLKACVEKKPVTRATRQVKDTRSNLRKNEEPKALKDIHTTQISLNEPSNGPTFQRKRLQTETDRLKHLADSWAHLKENECIPLNIKDEIDAVVGQTRLLLSKKFEQFRGLIVACETQNQDTKTTPDDLDGFWEMMYIQVEQLDGKYKSLEDLKTNGWVEQVIVVPRKKRSTVVKPVKKPVAKSRFREIMAQRKETLIESNESVKQEAVPLTPPKPKFPEVIEPDNNLPSPVLIKTPFVMKNILSARRSRSSIAPLVTLRHSLLAKSIGSPARQRSPLAVPPLSECQNTMNSLTPKVEFNVLEATPPASSKKRLTKVRKGTPYLSEELRRRTRSMAKTEDSLISLIDTSAEFFTPVRL